MDWRASGVVFAVAWLAQPAMALACAPAPRQGDTVLIHAEEALIVYDEAARLEHFVRRADFGATGADFGFLVPTPTPPELAEVDDDVFFRLADAVAPAEQHETDWTPMTCCTAPFQLAMLSAVKSEVRSAGGEASVTVLSTARVAGLDATVLRATDVAALGAWLSERGYEMRPALSAWLDPYVEAGFAITAFRIAKGDPSSRDVGTRAVRMTFSTDRPFYPYREPSDTADVLGRALRVFLVAGGRYDGRLDDGSPWRSDLEYARPLRDPGSLLAGVPHPSGELWLSAFIDLAPRRATGGDLWLSPATARGEVVPAPIVVYTDEVPLPLPVELVVLVGVVVWRRRRRRAAAASA